MLGVIRNPGTVGIESSDFFRPGSGPPLPALVPLGGSVRNQAGQRRTEVSGRIAISRATARQRYPSALSSPPDRPCRPQIASIKSGTTVPGASSRAAAVSHHCSSIGGAAGQHADFCDSAGQRFRSTIVFGR